MLRRCLLAGVWGVWIIKPTFNRSDEGPGFLPGLFSCVAVTWGGWHQVAAAHTTVLLSFEGTSFLLAGSVLIFLSSLVIVFPNPDLIELTTTEVHSAAIRALEGDIPSRTA